MTQEMYFVYLQTVDAAGIIESFNFDVQMDTFAFVTCLYIFKITKLFLSFNLCIGS